MALPELVKPLQWLIGSWRSTNGSLLTPRTLTYHDDLTVSFFGTPCLQIEAFSTNPALQKPMHRESGFIRFSPDGKIAVMFAHNFGVTELLEGQVQGESLILESTGIQRMSFGNDIWVTQTKREYHLQGENQLKYNFFMATTKNPELNLHLTADYVKQ
jgi:hypothetical protein